MLAKLSPGVNINDVAGPTLLPKAWDKRMKVRLKTPRRGNQEI